MAKVDDIIQSLISIRKGVGSQPVEFPFDRVEINNDLTSISEVEALFHPSGYLMEHGMPVFVYIRDHTVPGYLSPLKANKVHFYRCRTLREMRQKGKFNQRYRVTNRDDNRYTIDVKSWTRAGRAKEEDVILYPCQNCLSAVSYQCFHYRMVSSEREDIVKNFDAKAAFALIGEQFEIFRKDIAQSGLSSASLPAGYPDSWKKISREFRRSKGHTCEQCGVQLKDAPQCLDVHHKDYDKQNIRNSNLACLCKCCHAKLHKHYNPGYCRYHIERAQKMQGCMRTCS